MKPAGSRQRVLDAIRHRESDRVPVDIGSTPSSGISAIAYGRLRQALQISSGQVRVYDVVQQLAQPEDWFLERFGVDVVDVGRVFNEREQDWYDIRLPDGQPAQYPAWFRPERQPDESWIARRNGLAVGRLPSGSAFFEQTHFPWAAGWPADDAQLDQAMATVVWAALPHSPWDAAALPGFWDLLRERALELRRRSDRAIMVVVGCNLFEWGTFLRRLDNFLMDLLLEEARVQRLLDALLARHLATLESVCRAVGDVADVVRFGDDLGTDSGPFFSRELYRRLFKPRHRLLCDYVRAHSSMATLLHSCGSIAELLPDLIEAGFQIINPVQTSSRDMEPERLKREFGRDLVFWGGGVDTRAVLNRGSPAEVRRQVLGRLEVFSRGGGFVFNPVHNILPDVPPQNVLAMFEALDEFHGEAGWREGGAEGIMAERT